jgi:general secretion pathway protein A
MYCEFYQLTERPFNVTPDPKFLYLNARYREAIASLNYGITQRKGFITLIGEAGTGKTTLMNKLLDDLDPKTKSVFIFNTNVTFEEILEYIFAEFDLPVHNGKRLYMLQRLNTFLLEELRNGGNVALLIDEAQDLEFSVLEDLRLLSNLETAKEKILQIVLSGQPELGQKLSNPVLRQLRQRIGINCRLLPLSRDEITEYIQYRLQAAGCPDLKLFSREAEEQVYHFSRGIPRLVNVVCDNALVIGYALGKKRIGADVITEAAADLLSVERPVEEPSVPPLEVSVPPPPVRPWTRWRARFGVMGLVMVAIVIGLLSVGRTTLYKHVEEPMSPAPEVQLEVIRPGSRLQGTGVDASRTRSGEGAEPSGHALPRDPVAANPELAAPSSAKFEEGVDEAVPVERMGAAVERGASAGSDEQRGGQPLDERQATNEPPGTGRFEEPVVPPAAERHLPGVQAVAPAIPRPVEPRQPDAVASRNDALRLDDAVHGEAAAQEGSTEAASGQLAALAEEQDDVAETAGQREVGRAPRLDGVRFASVVVRDGDSMSGIARRKYGQASYTILDLLKLANPQLTDIDLITVGQTIRLPELGEGFPILNDGSGHYALLVFSSPQALRASALQRALRSHGFEAHVSGGSVGFQKPMFRVLLTGFGDRGEVEAMGTRLQKLFREDSRIAQLGE